MKTKIFNWGNAVINILFAILIFTTLYFALISPNLLLKSEHTNGVTLGIIAVTVIFGLTYAYFARFRSFLKKIFFTWRFNTAPALFIAAIVLQYIYVWKIHPAIGFDVGAIHNALLNPNDPDLRGYFSVNYNNLSLLLFQKWISSLFHANSWFFFAELSVSFTVISALLNLCSVAVINWRKLPVILYFQAAWLALFPMSIVPYSDIWSLPFVSLYLLAFFIMARANWPFIIRILAAAIGGLSLTGAYLIKPSAIIPFIALTLVSLLALLKRNSRSFWIKSALCFLVMVGVATSVGRQFERMIDNQHYIYVDKERANPMIHFVQIGMTGQGGYSPHDDLMMGKLYSKQEKEAYSRKRIKQTLQQRGVGYLKFLIEKQGRNTADATFSWLLEGHFFRNKVDNQRVKSGLASFVYPNGDNLDDFRLIAQCAWIIMLTLIAFGWQNQRLVLQALRLGIIGGCLFLLIFEGGRSRYLIQFLPVFLLLATMTSQSAGKKIRALFSWLHE